MTINLQFKFENHKNHRFPLKFSVFDKDIGPSFLFAISNFKEEKLNFFACNNSFLRIYKYPPT